MGVVLCEFHGRQGVQEMCPHVDRALRQGLPLETQFASSVEVCSGCIDRFGLERFVGVDLFSVPHYDLLHLESCLWCSECRAVAILERARRAGSPDPFPAYERTLTYLQQDTVDRLRVELSQAFEFRDSIRDPRRSSMFVRTGGLTHPLQITIYYVTDPARQRSILDWIAQFFAQLGLTQYQVIFYREETCQWSGGNIVGWSQRDDELLRTFDADPPGG